MSKRACIYFRLGCPAIDDFLEEDLTKAKNYLEEYCLKKEKSNECVFYSVLTQKKVKIMGELHTFLKEIFLKEMVSRILSEYYLSSMLREEIRKLEEYEIFKKLMKEKI